MASLSVENLYKNFHGVIALDHISFEVKDRSFVTILGPSGCGKTTALRCIAGLEDPEEGVIKLGEETVFDSRKKTNIPARKRAISLVFQSYALWPHMTVFENIALPLRVRKIPEDEIGDRISKTMELLGLTGLETRFPLQMSGGQQQRVALARSIVYESRALLLDEPLSNLDEKIREKARLELKEIQKRVGATVVYVTHNQAEALSLSDEIIVMNKGRFMQVGTPQQIYEKPANMFVAEFVGTVNSISGKVSIRSGQGSAIISTEMGQVELPVCTFREGEEVLILARPSDIKILETRITTATTNLFEGNLKHVAYQGSFAECIVQVFSKEFHVISDPSIKLELGQTVYLELDPARLHVMPQSETEETHE